MKISYEIGDATQPLGSGPKIIVHICNDLGGWGKGFVVAISRRWREPELRYRAWHRAEDSQPFALGQVQFVAVADDVWVANLIGQQGMGVRDGVPPIRYDAVREGLRCVATKAKNLAHQFTCLELVVDWPAGSGTKSNRSLNRNSAQPASP